MKEAHSGGSDAAAIWEDRSRDAYVSDASFILLNPGLSLVSLGPTILYPHSPSETAVLDGLEELACAVARVVERIA